ncbi:hypothetical protein E2320_016107 [Naja naja]|nr:hypothetical protein E2320_016107 [Naja naja]
MTHYALRRRQEGACASASAAYIVPVKLPLKSHHQAFKPWLHSALTIASPIRKGRNCFSETRKFDSSRLRLWFAFLDLGPIRSCLCREAPRSGTEVTMNCRSEVLEISVEGRQIEEAMLALLHTILLHRSTGKFHYKKEGTYSIGTVGTQDVDCDFIDFTYVRVSSEELDRALRKAVGEFKDALRNSGSDGMGQISLEFYQKKKSRWPFSDECIPWEVWTVKVNVVSLANEQERQICREKVGEKLCEKIINIVEVMNRHEYLPKMPTQSEVDNVFDTGLRDVQPYLYKISYQITDSLGTSVTTTMRRLIKDTLAL